MCRETKYSGVTIEVDTFTMPITDELTENGVVVSEEQRFNSGIVIKLTKARDQ